MAVALDMALVAGPPRPGDVEGTTLCAASEHERRDAGGYAALLLDSAMGCAAMTLFDEADPVVTVSLEVKLVRALTVGVPVVAEGTVVHGGRSQVTLQGYLRDRATGALLAHGTSTCVVVTGQHFTNQPFDTYLGGTVRSGPADGRTESDTETNLRRPRGWPSGARARGVQRLRP